MNITLNQNESKIPVSIDISSQPSPREQERIDNYAPNGAKDVYSQQGDSSETVGIDMEPIEPKSVPDGISDGRSHDNFDKTHNIRGTNQDICFTKPTLKVEKSEITSQKDCNIGKDEEHVHNQVDDQVQKHTSFHLSSTGVSFVTSSESKDIVSTMVLEGSDASEYEGNDHGKESKLYKNRNSIMVSALRESIIQDSNEHCSKDPETWPSPLGDNIAGQIQNLSSSYEQIRKQVESKGEVLLRIVTWNQQSKVPPSSNTLVQSLLPRNKYHIIAFGTQECEHTIVKSIIVTNKIKWEEAVCQAVGEDYEMLRSHSLQAIHNIVFVHKAIVPLISKVNSIAVATGLFNDTLGNKGGVGISFLLCGSSFCFLNCHLAAHQNAMQRRSIDFEKICVGMTKNMNGGSGGNHDSMTAILEDDQGETSSFVADSVNPLIDLFDKVYIYGDLNFRIHGTREIVDGLLQRNMREVLLNNDELTMLMRFNPIFSGFSEGPVNFRPTYKFDQGSDTYDSSKKKRIPSWTDRILYKKVSQTRLIAYNSAPEIKTSDHRPVYASFHALIKTVAHGDDGSNSTATSTSLCLMNQSRSQVCSIS